MQQIIPTEDIRSETMSFQQVIIRSLDRIHFLASAKIQQGDLASINSYQESVALLHCFLAPYYKKDFELKTDAIQAKLNERKYDKSVEKIYLIRAWLQEIVKNLGVIGLLPAVDVAYDTSTPEQLVVEEKVEFERLFRRWAKKDEAYVEKVVKLKGDVDRKSKWVKPDITIKDIIHSSYLSEEDKK